MKDVYDVDGLVQAFGGRLGLIDKLKRGAETEVKRKTVEKWIERGSIPGNMLIRCEIASKKLELGVSITDYIIK